MSHYLRLVHKLRASCELAPDGTFMTQDECQSDDVEKCGWKFMCDQATPGFCKQVQQGGTFATADECLCVGCYPSGGDAGTACSNQASTGGKCGFKASGGTYKACEQCRCSTTAYASVFPGAPTWSGTRAGGQAVSIELGRFVTVGNAITLNGSGTIQMQDGDIWVSYKVLDAATGQPVSEMISPNGGGIAKNMKFNNLNGAPQPFVITPDAGFTFLTVNKEYIVQVFIWPSSSKSFTITTDTTVVEQWYRVDYVPSKPAWQELGKPGRPVTVFGDLGSAVAQGDHISFEFVNDTANGVRGQGQVDIYGGSGTDRGFGSLAMYDTTTGLCVAQAPISNQATRDDVGFFYATTSQTVVPSVPGRTYALKAVISSYTDDSIRYFTYPAAIRHFNYGSSTLVSTFWPQATWPKGTTTWNKVAKNTQINTLLGELTTGPTTNYITLQGGGTCSITGGSGTDYITVFFKVLNAANQVVFQGLTGAGDGYYTQYMQIDRESSPHPFTVTPDVAFFQVSPNTLYRFYLDGYSVTDDNLFCTINPLTVEQWQKTVTLAGSGSLIDFGNRMEQRDYYIPVGQYANAPSFFQATGLHVDMLGKGRIELGDGSGTDRLEASFVIKHGPPQNNTADAAAQPTVYQGTISRQASRNVDAYFFVNREESFIPVAAGQIYTVYVKLSIQSDDTVRVGWDPIVIVQYDD